MKTTTWLLSKQRSHCEVERRKDYFVQKNGVVLNKDELWWWVAAPIHLCASAKWEEIGCEEANREKASHATHLSKLLINDSKLEVVAYDVFVESDDEPGGLWESRRFQ